MLMINRVELAAINEIDNIRNLYNQHPIVFEQEFGAGNEALQVGDVRKHIVAQEDVGANAVIMKTFGQLKCEKAV